MMMLPLTAAAAPQSALHPAGSGAARIAELFWWMGGAALAIWLLVLLIAFYARSRPAVPEDDRCAANRLIIGGGAVFPTAALAALLIYSLPLTSEMRTPRTPGGVTTRIEVSGEQWWWRVRYLPQEGTGVAVDSANEIRLPAGQAVEFILSSPDVIHSFWIPSLGGKVDMIPGRITTLVLEPLEPGVYRGACAEYCGASHAVMNFMTVVMEPAAFARWLERAAAPARPPADPHAARGQRAFMMHGCGACHTVRGTAADGRVGPDLTHVGGRLSLGAAVLPNTPDAFARWIGHTQQVKPEVKMPAFGMLPDEELAALAAYLSGLK